jgi:hypothetical protein
MATDLEEEVHHLKEIEEEDTSHNIKIITISNNSKISYKLKYRIQYKILSRIYLLGSKHNKLHSFLNNLNKNESRIPFKERKEERK